jgi:hypothetical protein
VWLLVRADAGNHLVAFLLHPYAAAARNEWLVPLRFGRKLWFAVLVSAWNFSDPANSSRLAVLVFASVTVFLLVQVRRRAALDQQAAREGVAAGPVLVWRDAPPVRCAVASPAVRGQA